MKLNSHIISGISIIILGIIVSFSVIIINLDYYKMYPNIKRVEGTIEDIDLEKYTTTVVYQVNGETITKKLNLFDSSFKVGNTTDIYYDEDEPIKSYLQCEVVLYRMMLTVGFIIIITGICLIINYFIRRRHFSYLKENGKKIKADISSIENKKFLSILPHHPSYICASTKLEGVNYNFLSETVYNNSIKYLNDKKVKKVDVYINEDEIGDYYVDISFIN